MYERFLSVYPPDSGDESQPYDHPLIEDGDLTALVEMGAGLSFGRGVLRLHDGPAVDRARDLIVSMFPGYRDSILPFAKDWLGRQFAVHLPDRDVLLVEPGSGQAFHVDCAISELFDSEFVADPDTYLAADLFAAWKAKVPGAVSAGQCVGFKVPLFLGGAGSIENLEVTDEEVYWEMFAQLKVKTEDLPSGASVQGVEIAE